MFPTEQEWMKNRYREMVATTIMVWSDCRSINRHILEARLLFQGEDYVNGHTNWVLINSVENITRDFRVIERLK